MGDIVNGIDASSSCSSSIVECLQNEGIRFVGRYYSRTTQIEGKKLTSGEAALLSGASLQIVAVYEDDPVEASYFSAERGAADAAGAMEQAEAVGQPKGSAIYFTVDYDASASDVDGNITAYFTAIQPVLQGSYAVGVYGSGAVCSAITQAGLAELAWLAQSTGWRGYSQFTTWAIKQGAEQTVCSLDADTDTAHGAYGGFTV